MGALLQLVGLQGKPSQSLIKAPSADLIKSDNEFSPPEPEEIQLEKEIEKLAVYAQMANKFGFSKQVVGREKLLHFLKYKNFKIYDRQKVLNFMDRYIDHAFKNLKLGDDLWWK